MFYKYKKIVLSLLLPFSEILSVDCKDKGTIVCKDGVSFDQVEQTVRQLDPNMPEILITQSHGGSDLIDTLAAYNYSNHKILVNPQTPLACNSNSIQWTLLHESGHSQYPKFWNYKIFGSALTACGAAYCVKLPVKSMVTKLASKYLLTCCFFNGIVRGIQNLEERRADAWANKCADKQAIQAQIDVFSKLNEFAQRQWNQNDRSYYIPYSVGQYIGDLEHPSYLSRIKACQRALTKRFGTNV